MKLLYGIILGIAPLAALAQTKVVSQAIVHSKTEINFPQNFNRPGGGDNDDGGGGPSGMASKNTIYMRGDQIKTLNQSDFGNNITIIDKKNKTTTTLIEAMGRKTGYTVSDAEQEEVQKRMQARMDSLRQARGQNQPPGGQNNFTPGTSELIETSDTKKIADQVCKKLIIRTKSRQGETSETIVWYTPDFKMAEGFPVTGTNMGGGRGFAGRGRGGFFNTADLEKINGFVMGYELERPNGFSMKMEVTKIELNPAITDKTFEIPKGYEMKSAQEVQNMFLPGGRP